MLDAIVADLPNWPSDLCEKWLLPESDKKGWPPASTNDWRYVINRERDLSYLQALKWTLTSQDISPQRLIQKSMEDIINMFRGYYWKDPTEFIFSRFDDGRERFEGLVTYIQEHGGFPWPPALEQRADGLDILDGHHRCLAYFYIRGGLKVREDDSNVIFDETPFEFWIAQTTTG